MLILAVDPGTMTGFAYAFDPPDPDLLGTIEGPMSGQLPPQEFCQFLEKLLLAESDAVVVVEKFTISQRTLKSTRGGSYDAIEVTGVCRYFSGKYCGRDIEQQQPAEAMNLFTNEWLKERGWYVKQEHARDALRHLALALAKRKLIRVTND